MKKYSLISLASLAIAAILMPACTPNAPSEDKLFMNEDQVKEITAGGTVYNINDFLDAFMTEEGNFASESSPYRTRTYRDGKYLFSIDTLPTNGPAIFIRGRVITDDYGGNFYKSLVIQQTKDWKTGETIDQQCLRISLDMGSASGLFHRGQEILIKCNGFAVGRYANQPQLCVPSYNNNLYADHASEKVGWAPGRIPSPRFRDAVTLVGTPDVSKLVYDEMDLATLHSKFLSKFADFSAEIVRYSDGRLVRVTGVHFTGKSAASNGSLQDLNRYDPEDPNTKGNPEEDENAYVFGPTTGNVGYPQSRYVSDGSKMILVSTSEYAKYAYYYLPAEKYVGSVTGVLGYYMDNGGYEPAEKNWSISPNNMGDILPEAQAADADPRWIPVEWEKGVAQPED